MSDNPYQDVSRYPGGGIGNDGGHLESKNTVLALGAAVGLVLGLTAAHLFNRAAEENGQTTVSRSLKTSDIFRIALAAIALIRQISSLGAGSQHSKN